MTVSVRNEFSEEFVVGDGGECPQCLTKVKLMYHRTPDKITGTCKTCGRVFDEKFTKFKNECSCGCGHLALSVVVGNTFYNVMSTCKCVNGKYKTHTIQRKIVN